MIVRNGRSLSSVPPPMRPGPAFFGLALQQLQAPLPPVAEMGGVEASESDTGELVSSQYASSRSNSFADRMDNDDEISVEDWTNSRDCAVCLNCESGLGEEMEDERSPGSHSDTGSTVEDSGAGILRWLCSDVDNLEFEDDEHSGSWDYDADVLELDPSEQEEVPKKSSRPGAPQLSRSDGLLSLSDAFPLWATVRIHSMGSAAHLNGLQGKVVGFQDDLVKVEFPGAEGTKALRSKNLKVVQVRTESWQSDCTNCRCCRRAGES